MGRSTDPEEDVELGAQVEARTPGTAGAVIAVRVPRDQLAKICEYASLRGLTVSEVLREGTARLVALVELPEPANSQAADVHYTIWHLDTGNLIGDYATEAAALAVVRDEIQANASPDVLVLQRERAGNDPELVASGPDLATRAFRAGPSSASPDRITDGS